MAKKRVVYNLPTIAKKFTSLDEVTEYLRRFSNSMALNRPNLFQGDVFVADRPPSDQDGKDGDLWVEHEPL